jgi:hypothetical protein
MEYLDPWTSRAFAVNRKPGYDPAELFFDPSLLPPGSVEPTAIRDLILTAAGAAR